MVIEEIDVRLSLFTLRDFNDPASPDIINGWVNEKTNGKIEEIISGRIDPLTMMFLINAIYFKGTWTYTFDEALTHDGRFFLPDCTSPKIIPQ